SENKNVCIPYLFPVPCSLFPLPNIKFILHDYLTMLTTRIPSLENGDRMNRFEFEKCYAQMPENQKLYWKIYKH
ncbi:MAG: hypothetical protein EAZ87_24095, partial [Nostocales cyanobacterium]